MRILTGGHAIWMGGWTTQVQLSPDVIDTEGTSPGGLRRTARVLEVLEAAARETETAGEKMLPPAWALADSLAHADHRIMPPDEIDPDYVEEDARPVLRSALAALGVSPDRRDAILQDYDEALRGDPDTCSAPA